MVSKRITFTNDPSTLTAQANLEKMVADFFMEWHYEDNLQEVLNMALMANNIPANVIKVGGPADTAAFFVQPYPAPNNSMNRKLIRGF